MADKNYTLYFKGKNKYGHIHELPIVTSSLKTLDIYTCNYMNYIDLFNNLPLDTKRFIEDEFGCSINFFDNNELKKCFYLSTDDSNDKLDLLFKDDYDIVYVSPIELTKLICKEKMSYKDFGHIILGISTNDVQKNRYSFFKYLYDKNVYKKPLLSMIDTYDIEKNFSNLDSDNTLVASIATDKNNIIILCKKISQTNEGRRDLSIRYKKIFKKTMIDSLEAEKRKNKVYNEDKMILKINQSIDEFKKEYFKQYEMA